MQELLQNLEQDPLEPGLARREQIRERGRIVSITQTDESSWTSGAPMKKQASTRLGLRKSKQLGSFVYLSIFCCF